MQTIALFALNLELGTNSSLFTFPLHSLPNILRDASMCSLSSLTTM